MKYIRNISLAVAFPCKSICLALREIGVAGTLGEGVHALLQLETGVGTYQWMESGLDEPNTELQTDVASVMPCVRKATRTPYSSNTVPTYLPTTSSR